MEKKNQSKKECRYNSNSIYLPFGLGILGSCNFTSSSTLKQDGVLRWCLQRQSLYGGLTETQKE